MRRLLSPSIVLVALLSSGTASAQERLNAPTYYLSQLPELVMGAVLEGELTSSDGQNFKDGSYLDLYVLHGQEGDRLELSASSSQFDAYLTLVDPEGQVVAWNDDGGGDLDAEIVTELPQTGRYLVVVSGYGPRDLGRYTISRDLPRPAPVAQPLHVPGMVNAAYDESLGVHVPFVDGPGVRYRLEPDAQGLYSFRLQADGFDAYLVLTDEQDRVIASNDDENYSEASGWNTDSLLFADLGPGVYYLYVTSMYGVPAGEYTLATRRYVAAD